MRVKMNKDWSLIFVGVLISLILVVIGTIWLSYSQETLDRIAEHFGAKKITIWNPPLPEYEITGFQGSTMMSIITGSVFTLLVLFLAFIVGKGLKAKAKTQD